MIFSEPISITKASSQTVGTRQVVLATELFVLSFVSLYLELLVIRWMSGEVRFFTVFKTFPLIACFIGLGLGFVLSQRQKLFRFFPLTLLAFVGLMKLTNLTGIMRWPFPSAAVWSWQDFFHPTWMQVFICTPIILLLLAGAFLLMLPIGARLGELFENFKPLSAYSINLAGAIAGSMTFAAVSFLGWHPWVLLVPVVALTLFCMYGILARICAGKGKLPEHFVNETYFCVPLGWRYSEPLLFVRSLLAAILPVAVSVVAVIISYWPVQPAAVQTYWSPYQELTVLPLANYSFDRWTDEYVPSVNWLALTGRDIAQDASQSGDLASTPGNREPRLDQSFLNGSQSDYLASTSGNRKHRLDPSFLKGSYVVHSNHWFYQYVLNLENKKWPPSLAIPQLKNVFEENARQYTLPYRLVSAKEVLIVGAGTGNDVAAALRNGATHVDAVDIDPVILELGRRLHPEHPYDSQKVRVICEDARRFFSRCRKQYDLILFGGLDSHTVTGLGSSVRIDTYVHTKESFVHAASLLKPGGLMIVVFNPCFDWLKDKMFCTIREAVKYNPLVLSDGSSKELRIPWKTFVVGDPIRRGWRPAIDQIKPFMLERNSNPVSSKIVTDDWPYLYVSPQAIDVPYCLFTVIVLLISIFAALPLFQKGQRHFWQLFFIGAAFLVLELKCIAQLSLLFGSTWYTASWVIVGILATALVANLVATKFQSELSRWQSWLYGALIATLLVSYLVPGTLLVKLASDYSYWGTLIATAITVLPVLPASLIFAVGFARVLQPSRALGFNLFGCVLGGLLEYASHFWGINSLLLIAAVLYFLSYFSYRYDLTVTA